MSNGYAISFSITALCPCCGKAAPSNSYLTEAKPSADPFDRDNPYERKDRRVFITPCQDCFVPKRPQAELIAAMEEVLRISDRKHDAWDKAKALIAEIKQ